MKLAEVVGTREGFLGYAHNASTTWKSHNNYYTMIGKARSLDSKI